jgi:hypothetical protein
MTPSYNKVADPTTDFYGAYLLISSYSNNNILVSYFDPNTGSETVAASYSISARIGVQIPLTISFVKMSDTNGESPEFRACHVIAKRGAHVEFFSTGACAGGSFLALQTALLGNKYVIASYQDNPGNGGLIGAVNPPSSIETSHGFFEIISTQDSTKVTITPAVTTMGHHPARLPYTVTLKRGQCYLVKSAGVTTNTDLSGSIVESNNKVAVIAGHENAYLGSVNGGYIDGRNFMVQQMLPVTLWDSTGYVTIPLKDAQPADTTREGYGENFRIYSDDSVGVSATVKLADGTSTPLSTVKFSDGEISNIGKPIEIRSSDKKFFMMTYDLRDFATAIPYPAPSMMTVIPISRWKTSYIWYVPSNYNFPKNYANIIGLRSDLHSTDGIMASYNGGAIKPIGQIFSTDQQYDVIPNHPELAGIRVSLNAGTYYVTATHPFIVYSYGFRMVDGNFDFGANDGDDNYFSYGSPAGMSLPSGTHISAKVDTFCSSWNVCVHDSAYGLADPGIAEVALMDDPSGDVYGLHPGPVYHNCYLDGSLDPDHNNSIQFSGKDTDVCFKVYVSNESDSAYAPLFIIDREGNAVVVELHYFPSVVALPANSGKFLGSSLHSDSCSTFTLKNQVSAKANLTVNSVGLKYNTHGFSVTNTSAKLPTALKPGDSLTMTVCYNAKDTAAQYDTLIINSDCYNTPISLAGSGWVPLIWASNHDFGSVIVDSTKCDTVGVYNIGQKPFTLTKNWVLDHIDSAFSFNTTGDLSQHSYGSDDLPIVIDPGKKVLLNFCYTPFTYQLDTTTLFWGTSLEAPYKHSVKDYSKLSGEGYKIGFVWDRAEQPDTVYSNTDSQIVRVYLLNLTTPGIGAPSAHVDSVFLTGTNADEFYIRSNQLGFTPMVNFNLRPGESIWIDIVFKPSLVSPLPALSAPQIAQLIAHDVSEKDKIINFIGRRVATEVVTAVSQNAFTIRPNPAQDEIEVEYFNPESRSREKVYIFDALGAKVYSSDEIMTGSTTLHIDTRNLPSGMYLLRIGNASQSFVKAR